MRKLSILVIASILLVSCNSKVSTSETNETESVIASEEQEYRAMDAADKELRDSIGYSKYKTDEYGICEGAPEMYSAKNAEEEKLLSSFKAYFKAVMKNDVPKVKSYICPKVISQTKEKFPQYSDDDIDNVITNVIADFAESKEIMRTHFEGFKKAIPIVSQLYKLPSKEGCLLYSVHYSTVILCTADDENYYSWHMPMFMYAASYDNGDNWYFIELVEDTDEVLNDFR